MIIQKIKNSFYANKGVGLIPDEPDSRDIQFGLFLFDALKYKPKSVKKMLYPVSIKDQDGRNDCTFQSSVAGKEIDEGVELSVRANVIWAKEQGYIRGDGFSTLRNAQKVLQKFGAIPENQLTSSFNGWSDYTNSKYLTPDCRKNASKHKTKSYWRVNTVVDVLKAIDDGRPVQAGMDWFSGYIHISANETLPYRRGGLIGAHAVLIIGYDRNFNGEGGEVLIVQNSFSKSWGMNGLFYVKTKDFVNEVEKYGCFVNLDIPVDMARFLAKYSGSAVKSANRPQIYEIKDGKKYHIPTMRQFTERFSSFSVVDESFLSNLPNG